MFIFFEGVRKDSQLNKLLTANWEPSIQSFSRSPLWPYIRPATD